MHFFVVLGLSCFIATLGLLADSAVTVIGAMLIAPLMKPIMAAAYGLVLRDGTLVARATLKLALGVATALVVAAATEWLFELRGATQQILDRTHPTLVDLGVAVAAGVAAAMAVVRPNIAEALPGVAMAVALVPPLCVTGVAVSLGEWSLMWGAGLLFGINLFAIFLFALLVFVLEGYGSWRRAAPGLVLVGLVLVALSVPLRNSLRVIRLDDVVQQTIEDYLRAHYRAHEAIHPDDLRHVAVLSFEDHVFVFAALEANAGSLDAKAREELYTRIARHVDRPLNVRFQVTLTEEYDLYRHLLPDGTAPVYAVDDPVPRR